MGDEFNDEGGIVLELRPTAYQVPRPSIDTINNGDVIVGLNYHETNGPKKVSRVFKEDFSYTYMPRGETEHQYHKISYKEIEAFPAPVLFLREIKGKKRDKLVLKAANSAFIEGVGVLVESHMYEMAKMVKARVHQGVILPSRDPYNLNN